MVQNSCRCDSNTVFLLFFFFFGAKCEQPNQYQGLAKRGLKFKLLHSVMRDLWIEWQETDNELSPN